MAEQEEIPKSPVKYPRKKHMAATDKDFSVTDVKHVSVNVGSTDSRTSTPDYEDVVVQQGDASGQERRNDEEKVTHLKEELKKRFSHTLTRCYTYDCCLKKVPWKMLFLFVNIIVVTIQLIWFANERSQFASFLNRNNIALKHLLLKDWSKDYETMPYPPTTGTYGVYDIKDLEEHVQFVVDGIFSLPTTAVGSFFLNNNNDTSPIRICATYFESGVFNRTSSPPIITIDRTRTTQCRDVEVNTTNYGLDPSLEDLIRSENGVLVRLLELTLDFSISSIRVNMRREERPPACFEIIGRVSFDNFEINGQIPVILTTSIKGFECEGDSSINADAVHVGLFILVLIMNILTILSSLYAFVTSFILWLDVRRWFKKRSLSKKSSQAAGEEDYKPLSARGSWEILKFRDVILICAALLNIIGSSIKIYFDSGNLSTSDGLDVCGILLGTGCLLLWMLSLHYLAFNKVFGLLFRVLDRSALSIIRFLLVIFVLFIGFALCGWAVLGPHHIKFLSFTATFQCLLALMNGDEVYVTMTAVDKDGSQIASWFNLIFVTMFIFLFTIIILNVFIAIYNTTYEDVKDDKNPSDVMKFTEEEPYTLNYKKCKEECECKFTCNSRILCCK